MRIPRTKRAAFASPVDSTPPHRRPTTTTSPMEAARHRNRPRRLRFLQLFTAWASFGIFLRESAADLPGASSSLCAAKCGTCPVVCEPPPPPQSLAIEQLPPPPSPPPHRKSSPSPPPPGGQRGYGYYYFYTAAASPQPMSAAVECLPVLLLLLVLVVFRL